MKKVLLMVGEQLSANGICANSVMRELQSSGFKVICVTNQDYKTSKSETVVGIKIERILPRLTYKINAWCNHNSGKLSRILIKLSLLLNKLKLILSIPSWPLISPMYTYRFYRAAKDLYDRESYDCIIAIYTQIDTVIAAHFIKKKYPNVKFVPYFLDSLSGGYGPKNFSRDWIIKRGLKWEGRLLPNADKIIVMKSSQEHHEAYSRYEDYYSRMTVLDIPLLSFQRKGAKTTNILDQSKINLVYLGSIPYHIRNPKYILEVFKRLNIENCTFTIIGTNTCPDLISKAQTESPKNPIVLIKSITHGEAINVMKNADVLINIGNNISSMVPSKVFEYMSVGKPVISTYPIDDEPSISYLKMYPLSLLLKEDYEHIDEAVLQAESFINTTRNQQVDFELLKDKMYINTPQAFVEEIKKLF